MPTPNFYTPRRRLALASLMLVTVLFAGTATAQRIVNADLIDADVAKVVVRTHSAVGTPINSVDIDLLDPDSGEVFESLALATPNKTFVVLTGGDVAVGSTVELTVVAAALDDDGAPTAEQLTSTVTFKTVTTEKTSGNGNGGYTYTIWITPRGKLQAQVSNANGGWRGAGITAAKAVTEKSSEELMVARVVDVWRSKLATHLGDLEKLVLAAAAVGEKDTLLASHYETIFTDVDSVWPTLLEQRVKETAKGLARTKLTTRHDGTQLAGVSVQIHDAETGEVALDAVTTSPKFVDRTFFAPIEFEDRPDGATYLVLVDLLDAKGTPIGKQLEVELNAPQTSDEAVTTGGAFLAEDGSSVTLWHGAEEGYALVVEWAGDNAAQVASVDLTFEEPFEGPPPLETTVNLPLLVERAHWVVTGDSALPERYTVNTTALDAEGTPLSQVQTGGTDPGITYKETDPDPKPKPKVRYPRLKRIVIQKPLDCQTCSS